MLVKKNLTVKSLLKRQLDIEYPLNNKMNEKIFDYSKKFIDDEYLLAASLAQNPFGKTDIDSLRGLIRNEQILANLAKLNRLQTLDHSIHEKYDEHRDVILLFLIGLKIIFNNREINPEARKSLTKSKITYALELLKRNDVSEIRLDLEDKLFSYLNPKVYGHYRSLLQFSKKSYYKLHEEIREYFAELIRENGLNAMIESRLKTIYSIHKKIIEKNLLYSQILDTIGLRFIMRNTEDCYKFMGLIIKQYPIMVSKIKDYIAIPKNNGYQSIHLTIIYKNHPVEIQIRTRKMHELAQYGKASHNDYKNGKSLK